MKLLIIVDAISYAFSSEHYLEDEENALSDIHQYINGITFNLDILLNTTFEISNKRHSLGSVDKDNDGNEFVNFDFDFSLTSDKKFDNTIALSTIEDLIYNFMKEQNSVSSVSSTVNVSD